MLNTDFTNFYVLFFTWHEKNSPMFIKTTAILVVTRILIDSNDTRQANASAVQGTIGTDEY